MLNELHALCSLLMVTGRHVAGIMTGGGLGSCEAGRDGGATVISAAEQLDWNAWSPLEGGAQIAQGARNSEGHNAPCVKTLIRASIARARLCCCRTVRG